jgi:hypothetical protein
MASNRNPQSMEFIKPKLIDSPGLSISQDDGFANEIRLSFVEFGKDCARSLFGSWHDVARIGGRRPGVANESVQLVASARQ